MRHDESLVDSWCLLDSGWVVDCCCDHRRNHRAFDENRSAIFTPSPMAHYRTSPGPNSVVWVITVVGASRRVVMFVTHNGGRNE